MKTPGHASGRRSEQVSQYASKQDGGAEQEERGLFCFFQHKKNSTQAKVAVPHNFLAEHLQRVVEFFQAQKVLLKSANAR